ncbi:nucleotidyl transferase AbiEii/AbiGii toxin family protein [Allofrancisella inopinata]|uniref:Nucleotidyl transferase AbiEii/AbiGii toxin family protein n=2 Tax=Allofrancisella inopinata TaxID=1085647 RepID=A0AAE6YJJ2_9GAMM|nr:nucleotidyl transferase AbiEii/AbiGii toxin family protein [Allofrancisella inopinata]
MLKRYVVETEIDLINALKEVFQEVTLLGLYSGGFFNKAAFYGGTALRILYGLNRFSEDLDFTLLEKDRSFDIEKYFPFIVDEFEALGVTIDLKKKTKQNTCSDIESAFLKNDTSIHTLNVHCNNLGDLLDGIHSGKRLKIKIEIDINPSLKFQIEPKTLLMPKTFNIMSMTLPNLFAGKMHAILFRNWKTRVKGRDWYDLEWYVKQNVKLNLEHLQERMYESGDLDRRTQLNSLMLKELLCAKIDTLDIQGVIKEVSPFIKDKSVFDFWSRDYFRLLASKILIL